MEINLKLSSKQGEAYRYLIDSKHNEIGYGGGAGGGKSYLGVAWIRTMCMKYPGTRWFFGRKELTNLRKTTMNTYYKFLKDYNIPESNAGILNGKDNFFRFSNGSEILLLDLAYKPSDPLYTRFGSLEITGGFIDESNEVEHSCIDILNSRLGRQLNDQYNIEPKLLETFNPDKGHIYSRYYKPWKTGTLPDYRIFIPALVTDNKHLGDRYIQQLEKLDTLSRERLLLGNFEYDDSQAKLFRYDEILDLFTNNIDISDTKYITADVARLGDDKTVICYREGLHCKNIYMYEKLTTDQTAEKIKEIEYQQRVPRANIVVDSDGVGAGVADMLRGCYNFVNNSRPIAAWTEQNFSNLKTQCYYKLRELAERRQIRINADGYIRDNLEQELDNIVIKDPDKDKRVQLIGKDEIRRKIGRSSDVADSIMMRCVFTLLNRDRSSSPIPTGQAQSFESYLDL